MARMPWTEDKVMNDIPVIDITGLYSGSSGERKRIAAEIGAACRGTGFFYILGHGVSSALMSDVFRASEGFFALAEDTKRQVLFSSATGNRGYIPMKGEALDPTKPADLKEAFNIGLDLAPNDPEILAGARFRALNLWPSLPGFRATMLDYFNAAWRTGLLLHEAFADDLGLERTYFAGHLDRPLATLRLLHYPSRPQQVEAGQMGAGEHTDYGCVTLLATDDAGGLEVRRRDGEWLSAPHVPGAFVCNIGDCLMRWTNDIYVSTPHRVVNPSGRERYSVAFFLDPNPDAVISCLPGCEENGEPKYPPIRGDDYLQGKLDATYAASGLA